MTKVKIVFVLLVCSLLFCNFIPSVRAQESASGSAKTIESKFCTIAYTPSVDLKKVNARIKFRFRDITLKGNYPSLTKNSPEAQIAEKFDKLVAKVEKILDMYPRQFHIKVAIYKNQKQLDAAYQEIFGQANKRRFISFYIHKYTTIHISEQSIRAGVLAHEIGHAVVDHYFLVRPSEKIREVLSQYVELHLED